MLQTKHFLDQKPLTRNFLLTKNEVKNRLKTERHYLEIQMSSEYQRLQHCGEPY